MVVVSLFSGWERRGELLHEEKDGWLRASQLEASRITAPEQKTSSSPWPVLLGLVAIAMGLILSFVVFW